MHWTTHADGWYYAATFDNRATMEQLIFLAKVHEATPAPKYFGAFQKGLDFILAAQFPNGGWPHEWIECDKATIIYRTGREYSIRWKDGRLETGAAERGTLLVENLRHYARYLNGAEARPLTCLEDSRPFVHFNNLLLIASGHITTIPNHHLQRTVTAGEEWLEIEDIEKEMERFAADGRLPSENNLTWSQAGGRAAVANLEQLEPVARRIKIEREQEILAIGKR